MTAARTASVVSTIARIWCCIGNSGGSSSSVGDNEDNQRCINEVNDGGISDGGSSSHKCNYDECKDIHLVS